MPIKSKNAKPSFPQQTPNQVSGQRGESLAAEFLVKKHFHILDKNFRTPQGEIDIIAQDGNVIVFVEVKYRGTDEFGHPSIAVTDQKIQKITRAAEQYLQEKNLDADFRFDIISIFPSSIEHFENVTM